MASARASGAAAEGRSRAPSAALTVLLGFVLLVVTGCSQGPSMQTPSTATAIAATPSSVPSTSPVPESIAPAMPLEIRIPAIGLIVPLAADPCPIVDGVITPDLAEPLVGCALVVDRKPYVLPSTDAPDLAVIAGHTWARNGAGWQDNVETAAFNALYDWDQPDPHWTVAAGDELWVRTASSGARWLVYRATDFHQPLKDGQGPDSLAGSKEIWGDAPQPGRLLTIGCLRETGDPEAASQRNIVIGWVFERVAPAAS